VAPGWDRLFDSCRTPARLRDIVATFQNRRVPPELVRTRWRCRCRTSQSGACTVSSKAVSRRAQNVVRVRCVKLRGTCATKRRWQSPYGPQVRSAPRPPRRGCFRLEPAMARSFHRKCAAASTAIRRPNARRKLRGRSRVNARIAARRLPRLSSNRTATGVTPRW